MDPNERTCRRIKKKEWSVTESIALVALYILLLIATNKCETIHKDESNFRESLTKNDNSDLDNNVESKNCHRCQSSINEKKDLDKNDNKFEDSPNLITNVIHSISAFTEKYVFTNNTEKKLQKILEEALDETLSSGTIKIFDGIEIKPVEAKNETEIAKNINTMEERALFSSYTYEYRLLQKVKHFVNTHMLSINIPKATEIFKFRSFGLKKFFWPLLIGFQVFKSILLAMFLPSILGSFGKMLGKGLSHLSAASSQASYPPANTEDQAINNDNFMGYETNPAEAYAVQDGNDFDSTNDVNDLSGMDITRFGASGTKVSYLPSKTNYYKNQMAQNSNNYKIFQKIPASSMILSNYDPFYSPLLSRLDGIFARLGLAPTEAAADDSPQIGGQSLSNVKLEACREQLICLMYSTPAKYAPYSNLVSAQLSRELNELRRPVSDNPEILRFFRYMRAARQGQEGVDCTKAHPACATTASPSHTMIAAYQDINKLVTARKL